MPYDEDLLKSDYLPAVEERFIRANRVPLPSQVGEALIVSLRQGFDLGAGEGYESAKARHLSELETMLGLQSAPFPSTPIPPGAGPLQPWQGFTRWEGTTWKDDSGYRAPRLATFLPALRVLQDNPSLFYANLDATMGYWHGHRMTWNLKGDPWEATGLAVDTSGSHGEDLLVTGLRAYAERGLVVALTNGALFPHQCPTPYTATYARLGRICASVSPHVVAFHTVVNEPGLCSEYRDGPDSWPTYYSLLRAFQTHYPWNAQGTGCQGGDPESLDVNGEPAGVLLGSKPPASMAVVQGTRYPVPKALERAFDMGYHLRPGVGVLVFEEEPSGNNGQIQAVYQPMQDPNTLLAYYLLKVITGQGLVSLNSCGLWEQNPLASVWGFREIPEMFARIEVPEDVGTWTVANLHRHPVGASGVYRNDGSYSDTAALSVAHGGHDWRIWSNWHARARVFRAPSPEYPTGLHLDVEVPAGGTIFGEGGSPVPTIIRLDRL